MKTVEEKIDEIKDSVHRIDITLAKQHQSLIEHMRRTATNEKLIYLIITALVGMAITVLSHR